MPVPLPSPQLPPHNLPPPPLPTVKKNSLIQQTIKNHIDYLNNQKVQVGDALPPLHQIPSASIVTFNVTSLSRYTNNQSNVNNIISNFAKKYKIIFLQETKLLANDNQALKSILSNHKVVYSNNPLNTGSNATTYTAGVCTAISKDITNTYSMKTLVMPSLLQGHCLVNIISLPNTDFSFKLINLRLLTPSLNKLEVQESMISALRAVIADHPSKFTVLGGDFNFVEHGEDTTSEFKAQARALAGSSSKRTLVSPSVLVIYTLSFISPGHLSPPRFKTLGLRALIVFIFLTLRLIFLLSSL